MFRVGSKQNRIDHQLNLVPTMLNRLHGWLFIVVILPACWLGMIASSAEQKPRESKLPAEDANWIFTLAGRAGTLGDREYVQWTLTRDGTFKRQKGYKKLGDPQECTLSPEDVHEFYVNAAKMVQKGKQDSRPARGDGWVVILKISSETSELTETFFAGDFATIAMLNPEFAKIEEILSKQTFKKRTSR